MNHLSKAKHGISDEDKAVYSWKLSTRSVILMLTPIAPHMCHQLWKDLVAMTGNPVEDALWPAVDESALVEDEKLIIVQVNGKLRAKLTVAADASQESVEQLALGEENVNKFTDGKTIRKVIYVPGKLLNIVAN